jgi:DNA-binding GntR family transcriptional regulator
LEALNRSLGALRRAEASGVWKKLVEADLGFHEALVATGGTTRLRRIFDTLSVETRICLNRLEPFYPHPQDVVAEHEAIVRAIDLGDSALVATLIHQHMAEAAGRLTAARLMGAEQPG